MKRLVKTVLCALCLVLTVSLTAGCGKSSNSASGSDTSVSASADASSCPSDASGFAKTKFLLHAGLGFGAFRRYIYKPFRSGGFKSGADGRIKAFLKAGLAALFVKREVRLAAEAARKSPALCKVIIKPLSTVSETIQDAVKKLKGGDTSGITAVDSAISSVKSDSAKQGADITENENAPLK